MQSIRMGRSRRRLATVTVGLLVGALYVAAPGSALDLDASTFDADDGDQANDPNDPNDTDWVDLGVAARVDAPSGKNDDSLAGGVKDNTECPGTTTGSIPPNKDDLLHWYFDAEQVTVGGTTDIFFYLGYVRDASSDTASAHGVFELNQEEGGCPDVAQKGNQPPVPSPFNDRTTGDVRILFDYEGGDRPNLSYQTWDDASQTWSAEQLLAVAVATGQVNQGEIQDLLNGGGTLTNREFAEAKINMTTAGLLPADDCQPFASAGLFTGASGNSDNEQSKDFIAPSTLNFDLCGDLQIEKYIDANQDGQENGNDVTDSSTDTLGDLDGWSFTVVPAGGDPTDPGQVVCSGTTDAEGVLLCESLDSGTYDVYENLSGDFVNTDPGPDASGDIVKANVIVSQGGTEVVRFGNTCQITKVFEITAGTDTQGTVTAWYDLDQTDDAITSASVTYVPLVDDGTGADAVSGDGVHTGVAPELFDIGDQIEWGFGVDTDGDGDLGDEANGFVDDQTADETFADGYPTCLVTNTGQLDNPEIVATKFKDADDDGDPLDTHDPIEGWTIELYLDGVLQSSLDTNGAGQITFDDLAIGATYVVCEVAEDNWIQTYPMDQTGAIVNPDDCHSVGPMEIDASESVEFHNSPESLIRVGFTDLTGSTDVVITCEDANGNVTQLSHDSTGVSDEAFDNELRYRLRQGDVDCNFSVTDP